MGAIETILKGVVIVGFIFTCLFFIYADLRVVYEPTIDTNYNNTYDRIDEMYGISKEMNNQVTNKTKTDTSAVNQMVNGVSSAISIFFNAIPTALTLTGDIAVNLGVPMFILKTINAIIWISIILVIIMIFFKVYNV